MPGRPTNECPNYFALGKQAAKDTEASTFHFFKHLDGSGFEFNEQEQAEREGGDCMEVGLRYKTLIAADGAVNINARPGGAGRIMAWTLGQDTVASNAAGQDHTLAPVGSIPYLTADQQWADEVERSTNNQMTGYTLAGEAGRPLKITGQFVNGGSVYQRDVASGLTPVRESGPPFMFPFGSYVIDGAGNTKITKFEVQVTRGVDDGIQTVGLNREDVVLLTFDVLANFTLKYEDRTLYNKVHYGGGSQVPLNLSTGSFDIYSNAGSQSIRHVCPLIQYVDAKVNKLDPDGRTMYLDVSAMSIRGGTYSAFAVVRDTINATAAY